MEYRKKLIVLLSLIAALALIYTASLVFDPERAGSRSASYTWLDSRLAGRIAGVTISGGNEKIEIVKRNREWFVSHNGREYPARQLRVEDFISIFSTRAPYPVRSTGASSLVRLGLGEDAASRITVYGENTVLLDLLLGAEDSSGREIYLCKYGQNEVRSGDDKFSSYMAGSVNSWYNLRLIPETEDGKIGADSVQRLSVYGGEEPLIFSRSKREWTFSNVSAANTDQNSVDSYVRTVLNTEGDDFVDSVPDDARFSRRIVLELENGAVKTIRVSEPEESSGRCFAQVDSSDYIYSIPGWTAQRLFRSAKDFERQ